MEEILALYQDLRSLFAENDLVKKYARWVHCMVQKEIDRIPSESRIAIRPAGRDTQKLLELYDFSKKKVIGIVDQKIYEDGFCGYPCFTTDSFSTKTCDCVIICSFNYRQEIKEELEKLHIPYVDIYDELYNRGIRSPFLHHNNGTSIQLVVSDFYLRYLRTEAGAQREIALRELLQIAVEYKDFALISNIYHDCGGEYGEFPLLKDVWKKSEKLLNCIQNKLQERKQKDIILFWTDSVPYTMLHYLPRIMELSKQGAFFQRAYPNTPYTNPTMRAMFCKMLPIDDFPQDQEKIDSKNSPLIQFLENEGYKFRVIGEPTYAMGKEHLLAVSIEKSCNIRWWEGIMDLLQSPEPCFYIFHFMESHPPCYVPGVSEAIISRVLTQTQLEVSIKEVYGYLEKCLLLYHKLLGNKTQIFFSDHGYEVIHGTRWGELRLHTYCFVVGTSIPKITITRFFPYRNFEKLVWWLVDPTNFSLDDVCTDEVIFQDVDLYDLSLIDLYIQNKIEKFGIAYRGVFNYDYKYVINALGEDFFYQRQPDGTEKLVPLEDSALRAELRDKAGTKFLDIYQYDKVCCTRKLYGSIHRKKSSGNAT